MKRIGINQPGKIGDIIITLPIAQYFIDKGYEVVWPVLDCIYSHFKYFDDIKFIPVKCPHVNYTHMWYSITTAELQKHKCDKIFELSLRIPGYDKSTHKWNETDLTFDEWRYVECEVPFDQKWKLKVPRQDSREQELHFKIVDNDRFIVVHTDGSDCSKPIEFDLPSDVQRVNIKPYTDCIFDWLSIIENAEKIVMLDSCYFNLIEQLNIKGDKYFIPRSDWAATPIMRNDWKVICSG